jgi:tetratricopeptide (TPR) repeat protein
MAQAERIRDLHEAALRAGERPLIEAAMPDVAGPERDLLLGELIALDLAYRRRAGESPEASEYIARFPGDAAAVRLAFGEQVPEERAGESTVLAADETQEATPAPRGRGGLAEGTRIGYFGDYELLGLLGRGGMGVVYRAIQLSLNRPVALKMIRGEVAATEEDRRRFRNEAEIAAGFDHPHIVSVYEVGEHDGQPYLAMRLVEGEGLDRRLAAYAGDPRGAARLVRRAAEAVHHAHQRGVLHRDLKPANILIDAEGAPHVADFGLARLVEGGGELTASGGVVGTPAYMAPEQASGRRGGTSVATDVHGLGTILYTLLAGRAPFVAESVPAMLERVREAMPEPPSRFDGRVPRDLEVICLKCLEKEPARRYGSAQELADDLGRYLAGEPIRARPVGRLTRLGMWARRRPAIAALAGALAIAVATGAAGVAWQWRQALVQRDKAEAVRRFLVEDLLAQASPERNERSKNVTLLEVLDRAAGRIDRAFRDQPEVEAELRLIIGQVYVNLGEAEEAVRHLDRARRLRERIGGADSTEALDAGNDLAVALLRAGRPAEAEAAFRRVLEGYRRALGDDERKTLVTMSNLGDLLRSIGRPAEAEPLLRRASAGLERLVGRADPATRRAMGNLAITLHTLGRPAEAEPIYRQVLEAFREAGQRRHPEHLSLLNNHAKLLQDRGDYVGAVAEFREVVKARREVQGPAHPETLMSMNNLAHFYTTVGKPDQAEPLLEEVMAHLEGLPPGGDLSEVTAMAGTNLGNLLTVRGEKARAEQLYETALASALSIWNADHPNVRVIKAALDTIRPPRSAKDTGQGSQPARP